MGGSSLSRGQPYQPDYPGDVRLLALDTSTTAITVAVHDGTQVLGCETVLDARGHAEQLAPAIVRVLAGTGLSPDALTHVVVGTGPGPFTGLRVGVVTGLTLAHALGVPVGGVCSLDALAHHVRTRLSEPPTQWVVATDARRREVYWATYQAQDTGGPPGLPWRRISGPRVDRPQDLADVAGALSVDTPVAGRGGLLYPEFFGPPLGVLDVDAGSLAQVAVTLLASGATLPPPTPQYLRRPDARPLPDAPPLEAP